LSRAQSAASTVQEPTDTGIRRFEIGGTVADIRTGCIGLPYCYLPSFSVGAGAALNLNRRFAVDTNINVTTGAGNGSTNIDGGRAVEFLSGIRGELRARHYGYFVKAQPGFLHWNDVITQVIFPTPTTFAFLYGGRTRFVSDLGGGLEYSPFARIHMRVEIADLIVRYSNSSWSNDFQPTAGVYVGLGKPIEWTPPKYNPKSAHAFFDPGNLVLMTASVLAMTADGITTQRFLARGLMEGDPIAKPLVKYGWSGQITLEGLEAGGEVLGMYGLHRIGHHWIERAIPVAAAIGHGVISYTNTKANAHPAPTAP
jgi:hypothetical protein